MNDWQRQLIDRLPESMRRDLKKTAILAGLGVVFAGVLAFQFGRSGDGEAAAAEAVVPAVATAAPATPRVEVARVGNRVSRWLETPVRALDRNMFALRLENFQSITSPNTPKQEKPAVRVMADDLFWEQLAKSLTVRADQKRQRQIWMENLAAAAGGIQVTTTIMGPTPQALINGRRSVVGDLVKADANRAHVEFRVIAIEPRRLVLERDGVKFEVSKAGPARVISSVE